MADNLPPFEIPGLPPGGYAALAQSVLPDQTPVVPPASAPAPETPKAPPVTVRPSAPPPVAGGLALPPRRQFPQPPQPQYRDPLLALENPIVQIALLGSLFTRRPAIAAGNALAAAMEAQRKGDQQQYENAFTQYRQQLEELQMEMRQEQQEYDRDYMNKRLSLDERIAQMRMTAARRHDNLMMGAITAGQDPGAVLQQRIVAGKPVTEAMIKATAIAEMMKANPSLTFAEAARQYDAQKENDKQSAKAPSLTQEKAQAVDELMEKHRNDPDYTRAKAIQEVESRNERKGITGNKEVDIKERNLMADEVLDKIDSVMRTLEKYRMAAGVAGKVFRGIEIVGNITGVDVQTDREQMARNLSEIQMLYPRIVGGSGRPLAVDAARVQDIIAGKGFGDTTANTLRAMQEARDTVMRFKSGREGMLAPGTAQPTQAAPPSEVDWNAFPKAN